MSRPRSVKDAEVAGKSVLVRADLNVPLEDGVIADDSRIRASLPTLRDLLDRNAAKLSVCSHLGRPKGQDPSLEIRPVADRLRELLPDPRITVLENTRFDPGETKNDPETARRLADGNDLYVNDAFGSAHRAHASTEGVAHLLPAYAGLLLEQELEMLGRLLGEVERPFVLVAGGAKVDDKLGVLEHLGGRADTVLVGGKMAEELRSDDRLPFEAVLPSDVVAAETFAADAKSEVTASDAIPEGWLGLDIGPETRDRFASVLAGARTVFWNGPLGRLRVAALRGGYEGRRAGRRGGERIHGRRRRRLGTCTPRARSRREGLVGVDGRRCVPRAARGQGAPRRRSDSARLTVRRRRYAGDTAQSSCGSIPGTWRPRNERIVRTWRTRSSVSNEPCPVSNTYTSCGCPRAASLST